VFFSFFVLTFIYYFVILNNCSLYDSLFFFVLIVFMRLTFDRLALLLVCVECSDGYNIIKLIFYCIFLLLFYLFRLRKMKIYKVILNLWFNEIFKQFLSSKILDYKYIGDRRFLTRSVKMVFDIIDWLDRGWS